MGVTRSVLLQASTSSWLREHASRYAFVRRGVARFMPGEELKDALDAARELQQRGLETVLTHLGENVTTQEEAERVTLHYLDVLDQVRMLKLPAEISVKLTQLGLDLSAEQCFSNLTRLIAHAGALSVVWIDMESSRYVDLTLELFRRARAAHDNVGVCLQAYLYRTEADLASLLPLGPAIRLVKGAYHEPANVAMARKKDADENFFTLASELFAAKLQHGKGRIALATHDRPLLHRLTGHAAAKKLGRGDFEFQMLYGIQRAEQLRLAAEGYRTRVLISYGSYWFPWFMRRLAERPANLGFVARQLFSG
ncbi:MAG TPA: proline dehydrogenase family protein [Terriglobia bacterium]|nr:proline dehydrogenase family protein [Terriglobia bacterium]